MVKNIAVIGGGISGLALVHYLKKRLGDRAGITLYERNPACGGNIQSICEQGFIFETGPNGFLHNDLTLEFIHDLDLTDQLIQAASKTKRYIQIDGRLCVVPTGPGALLSTPLLSAVDKFLLIKGLLAKNVSQDQSVYEYASSRFGKSAAERLFDPFIAGVYAGDIKHLHMASAFSKFNRPGKHKPMYSFKEGMGQFIQSVQREYRNHIQCGKSIESLDQIKADHTFCTVPAYAVSGIVKSIAPELASVLGQIIYAPLAVVGLCFPIDAFKRQPAGFGYLIPSNQCKEILGVLLESNVFKWRAPDGMVMMRVMLGGRHNPHIIHDDPQTLVHKAVQEVDQIYGLKTPPAGQWVKSWHHAIPQYEMDYPRVRAKIYQELNQLPQLTLTGNYLDGIAFNDCINNAKDIAYSLTI